MAENVAFWIFAALAGFAVFGTFSLATFVLLHRMGRATGRFDRRERD